MKTLIASLVAVAAISTVASAGGHGHRHHGHHHGHHHHFKHHHFKHFYTPVYVAPVKCHIVYRHGYATKVCHKTYGH